MASKAMKAESHFPSARGERLEADFATGAVWNFRKHMMRLVLVAGGFLTVLTVPAPTAGEEPPLPVEPDAPIVYDLTEEQSAVLRTYLPKAHARFEAGEPVHVVVIGDSVSNVFIKDSSDNQNWVKGYPYLFLDRISEQFYYTGGVRVVQPRRGYPAKSLPLVGNEITMRTMSRAGRAALYANQIMRVNAFEHRPDVVLINFGINDARDLLSLAAYEAALREAVARVRHVGAEPVLLGPSLVVNGLDGMAMVRAYTMAMENVARQENVWFADLGNPGWFISAPAPESSPAKRIERAVLELQGWYGVDDLVHPNLDAHERIGQRLFKELLGERVESPLRVVDAWVTEVSGTGFRAHVKVKAEGHSTGDLVVAPLPTTRVFVPDQPIFVLSAEDVAEDGTWLVEFDYKHNSENTGSSARLIDLLDQRRRPVIPLHWLVMDDKQVGLIDAPARIEPLGVRWDFNPVWNSPSSVRLKAELVAGGEPVKGRYKASWLGHESAAGFELGSDGRQNITLEFPITNAHQRTGRAEGPLRIEFDTDRGIVVFERRLSALRNPALGESFPLEPSAGDGSSGNVDLTINATPGELQLSLDLGVGELVATAANPNAVVVELYIDARDFENRQRPGGTEPIRIVFPASPGAGSISGILPWSFGNGYAMEYPIEGFAANLEARGDGTHRVGIMIPSSYLYLHEWSLGNVDSQIGINVRVVVLQVNDDNPNGFYTPEARWSLLNPSGMAQDTANLGRIELSEKASGRWSVRLH